MITLYKVLGINLLFLMMLSVFSYSSSNKSTHTQNPAPIDINDTNDTNGTLELPPPIVDDNHTVQPKNQINITALMSYIFTATQTTHTKLLSRKPKVRKQCISFNIQTGQKSTTTPVNNKTIIYEALATQIDK